jgi:hypothetical protein
MLSTVSDTQMTTESILPFELTQESLANWLENLNALPQIQAANQLNLALKHIKNADYSATALFPILLNLTPLTLLFSGSLTVTVTQETAASSKSIKLGKLSIQLLRQLALLFCQLIETKQLSGADQQTGIYYALQLIGYCLRCYSLTYEIPSNTLWKKSAELYKLAVATQILTLPHPHKISEFKQQPTVDAVIKRNLLFSVLNPGLYKTEEINQLFQLANHHGNLLETTTANNSIEFGFYWDLQTDQPPYTVKKPNRSLPNGFLAINSQSLSHELQLGTLETSLTPSLQNRLALFLSGYHQVFNSITPGLPSRTTMITGFAAICQYLQELDKLSKISQLSGQHHDSKTINRNFSLVPLEHQRNVFETVDQTFSNQMPAGKLVNLYKTPNKNYSVAEMRGLDCLTGDIVLLYKEQHPVSIAIIRQQGSNDLNNTKQLLLDHIVGGCTIRNLSDSKHHGFAIVVAEGGEQQQVFLPPGKYLLNNDINLLIDRAMQLTACLESNEFYARFHFKYA